MAMIRNCFREMKMMLNGLRLVGRSAGVAHRYGRDRSTMLSCLLRRPPPSVYQTSASTATPGINQSTGSSNYGTQRVLKRGKVLFSKASMIAEGLRQFVRYASVDCISSRRNATAVCCPRLETLSVHCLSTDARLYHKERQPVIKKKQQLSKDAKESSVPSTRFGRLVSFGGLAASLGMGAVAEATRRTVFSKNESVLGMDVFLSEANVEKIVRTLCQVRGAALKVGQMMSLLDESIIGPQMANIFERVRQSADFMPAWQAEKVISDEFGADWKSSLSLFEQRPFAAASIGQVHLAELHNGRPIAIKIQYPGVATSIESDIRNLTATLKVWNILPSGLFLDNMMAVVRRELAYEVDYTYEAKCAKRFRSLLEPYPEYYVPEVIDNWSSKRVFTTELIDGIPLDKCAHMDQETRDQIVTMLIRLTCLELYGFRFMQTDPNWSNFFYNPDTKRIILLDFGAAREYSKPFVDKYLRLIKAAVDGDTQAVLEQSTKIGFLTGYESNIMQNAHMDAIVALGYVFTGNDLYDFGKTDLWAKLHQVVPVMLNNRLTPPPEEIYSLHRRIMGTFMLAAKLKARVNCSRIFQDTYEQYKFD